MALPEPAPQPSDRPELTIEHVEYTGAHAEVVLSDGSRLGGLYRVHTRSEVQSITRVTLDAYVMRPVRKPEPEPQPPLEVDWDEVAKG